MAATLNRLAAAIPKMAIKTVSFTVPRLQTFWRYAKVEMKPPMPSEFRQIGLEIGDIVAMAGTKTWRNLSVKETTVNVLVGVEVLCWFYIGECLGKGNVVGYQIPGTTFFETVI